MRFLVCQWPHSQTAELDRVHLHRSPAHGLGTAGSYLAQTMHDQRIVAQKCQSSSNSSYAFFQFIWLKRVVGWLENHATTSLKSCGMDNVDTTTLSTPEVSERVKLWHEHYSCQNFFKKLWRGFLVMPQLFSVRWIGRRHETNWKKTGTYGPPYQRPLPSARQHLSYGDGLQVKREYY